MRMRSRIQSLALVLCGIAAFAAIDGASRADSCAGAADCSERCPGELPDGTCPPDCGACACCAHASVVLSPRLPPVVRALVSHTDTEPASRPISGVCQRVFRPPRTRAAI